MSAGETITSITQIRYMSAEQISAALQAGRIDMQALEAERDRNRAADAAAGAARAREAERASICRPAVQVTRPPIPFRPATGWVYFVRNPTTGAIKIGFTVRDPQRRLAALQTGADVELELLATCRGTYRTENALHTRFQESRLLGEWFRPSPELLDLVARCQERLFP